MKAGRHRDRQLHLIFPSGRFDHGTRLLGQLNVLFYLKQLQGIPVVSPRLLRGFKSDSGAMQQQGLKKTRPCKRPGGESSWVEAVRLGTAIELS